MTVEHQLERQSAELTKLIGNRLGVGGASLSARLGRAGRDVPRSVRREAQMLVDAERMLAHPKLRKQVDPRQIDHAYRVSSSWLGGVDPAERRKDRVLGFLAVNVVNLGLLAAGILALLDWRGLI